MVEPVTIAEPFSGTPSPQFSQMFLDLRDIMLGLITDNLSWIVGWMLVMLAIRFAPALLSWFRNRNDPKQLGSV